MENRVQKTKIVPAICTQCSARIEVDPSLDAAICPHCRTAFIVEKAVNNFLVENMQNINIEHVQTININTTDSRIPIDKRYTNKRIDGKAELAIEKEKLKLEKARLRAEEAARNDKNTPLIVVAAVIMFIALMISMTYLRN